jgi:hypothetical protein
LKVAVTVVLALRVVAQRPIPEHPPPLQPAKVEPEDGVAERVIAVPEVTVSEQSLPQEIPVPVTVPDPVPDFNTVRVYVVAPGRDLVAVQEAVVPPFEPAQDHWDDPPWAGSDGVLGLTVPVEQ